jgi:hypothetical protein
MSWLGMRADPRPARMPPIRRDPHELWKNLARLRGGACRAKSSAMISSCSRRSARTLLPCVVLLALSWCGARAATAQPSAAPCQPCYLTPPLAPPGVVQVQLSSAEHELLARGEISVGRYVTGMVMTHLFGFGIGHAVQGRWTERGWIFTFGEAAAFASLARGLLRSFGPCYVVINNHSDGPPSTCSQPRRRQDGMFLLGGLIALVGLRVWEGLDVSIAPVRHNRRVRELRKRLAPEPGEAYTRVTPYLAPSFDGGAMAGLSSSF